MTKLCKGCNGVVCKYCGGCIDEGECSCNQPEPNAILLSVKRTGEIFSIAGSQYQATFPDGTTELFWSPVWHTDDEMQEDAGALLHAAKLWSDRTNNKAVGFWKEMEEEAKKEQELMKNPVPVTPAIQQEDDIPF